MTLDPQFFATGDLAVPGPPREIVGYGEHPPKVLWQDDARVAVQIVVNYEEGSEKTFAMGDGENDILLRAAVQARRPARSRGRVDVRVRHARRHLAHVPRLRRRRHPGHLLRAAVALERNPEVAQSSPRRGDEAAQPRLPLVEPLRDDARRGARGDPARRSSRSSGRCGTRPLGWYCREMSVNTRELVVEEGGFVYDSDCYSDDLPYWSPCTGAPHLVVPVRPRRERRPLRARAGLSQPGRLLRHRQGPSRPAPERRRRRVRG